MKNELIDQILKAFPNLEYDHLRHSLDKYHADKCAEEEQRQRIENAELYGNIPSNMPPCMMPDGGECCKEYASLYRAHNTQSQIALRLASALKSFCNGGHYDGVSFEELESAFDALQDYGEFTGKPI